MQEEAEQRKLDAEARKRELVATLPQTPVIEEIWLAASEVQQITGALVEDQTAAGSLVALANELARMMQELSALSKTGTKQDIIAHGRKIADMVTKIMNMIDKACDGCRDPILCQEMKDAGHVSKNFAVQLKIICGVKGNMILEDDPDAAQSLITCCKGMCTSVGDVVKLSQIAKLKPKK